MAPLHRTLEQELFALMRGARLECPVCGEFVLHEGGIIRCPECETVLHGRIDSAAVRATIRVAGRVTAGPSGLEESPDTAGQDARATEAAKADGKWHRKQTAGSDSPETLTVRVKRWGKSPPAAVVTRRLAKPRPVQGEQAPPRRPAEEPGSRTDGWSPSTESGLQACYREAPRKWGFSIFAMNSSTTNCGTTIAQPSST